MMNLDPSTHKIVTLKASQSSMQLNEDGIYKRLRSRNNDVCDYQELVEGKKLADVILSDQEADCEVLVERHRSKLKNDESS